LYFLKRKTYFSKGAREWVSFGSGMLFLNLVPLLTDGDMVNRRGQVVDPLWYFHFSLSLFVVSIWVSVFCERKKRLSNDDKE